MNPMNPTFTREIPGKAPGSLTLAFDFMPSGLTRAVTEVIIQSEDQDAVQATRDLFMAADEDSYLRSTPTQKRNDGRLIHVAQVCFPGDLISTVDMLSLKGLVHAAEHPAVRQQAQRVLRAS